MPSVSQDSFLVKSINFNIKQTWFIIPFLYDMGEISLLGTLFSSRKANKVNILPCLN